MNNDVSSKRRLSRFLQEGRGCCSKMRGIALVVEPSKQKTLSCHVYVVTLHCSFGTPRICFVQPCQIITIKDFVVVLKILIIWPATESLK